MVFEPLCSSGCTSRSNISHVPREGCASLEAHRAESQQEFPPIISSAAEGSSSHPLPQSRRTLQKVQPPREPGGAPASAELSPLPHQDHEVPCTILSSSPRAPEPTHVTHACHSHPTGHDDSMNVPGWGQSLETGGKGPRGVGLQLCPGGQKGQHHVWPAGAGQGSSPCTGH